MQLNAAQLTRRAGAMVRFTPGLVVVHAPSPDDRRDLVETLAGALAGRPGLDVIGVEIRGHAQTLAGELAGRLQALAGSCDPVLRAPAPDPSSRPRDVGQRISAFRDQLRRLEHRQHELIDTIVATSPNAAAVESVRVALDELAAVDPTSVHAKRTAYRLRQVLSRLHERRHSGPDDPELVTLRADLARLRHEAVVILATDRMSDEEMVGALEAHHGPAVAANPPWQKLVDALRAAGVDTRGLEPLSAARRWLESADRGGRERLAVYEELGALAAAIPVVRLRVIELGMSSLDPVHDEALPAALGRIEAKLPQLAGDELVGRLPLLVDDAFVRVDPEDLPAVVAQLVVVASVTQVVYVTGDPHVVAAAAAFGERAHVVELADAID